MSNIIERDPETEVFLDSLENNIIYRDMRSKYDEVTDNGDDYIDEHDEIVAKYASDKYEISVEEATNIYVVTEVEIAKFYQKRLGK